MSNYAIEARGIGKQYRIGSAAVQHDKLVDALAAAVKAPLRRLRGGAEVDTNWSLQDVSFTLEEGEVLGVVGRNGAGKSTLLKVLSRITAPTTGRADIRGRVGSLLEVGTGFHPELTGRENVYLNGSILGMPKPQIERRFDEIVEFSGVSRYIDTPVKRYSSGMYLRLAFAVAAYLEPDILIVDEVLAVGDAAFQKKCLGQLQEVTREGRTVLFVSHNMAAVQSLCTRAIMLEKGRLTYDGTPREVVQRYLSAGAEQASTRVWEDAEAPGTALTRLRAIRVHQNGAAAVRPDMSVPIDIEVEYDVYEEAREFNISIRLDNASGESILHSMQLLEGEEQTVVSPGRYVSIATIPADTLMAGQYWLSVSQNVHGGPIHFYVEHALAFEVDQTDPRMARVADGIWRTIISPRAVRWSLEPASPDRAAT